MKKAKLDLLDIPGLEVASSGEHQIEIDHAVSEPVENEGKWALNKILIIFSPLVLVILVAGGLLFYYFMESAPPASQTKTALNEGGSAATARPTGQKMQRSADTNGITGPMTTAAPSGGRTVYLKDFIIDLKDSRDNNYILMCDVAFDIGDKTKRTEVEGNAGVRDIIYRTAQKRSVIALRSVEERKKMKRELAVELEKMLGEGSVKTVYFTNYFLM